MLSAGLRFRVSSFSRASSRINSLCVLPFPSLKGWRKFTWSSIEANAFAISAKLEELMVLYSSINESIYWKADEKRSPSKNGFPSLLMFTVRTFPAQAEMSWNKWKCILSSALESLIFNGFSNYSSNRCETFKLSYARRILSSFKFTRLWRIPEGSVYWFSGSI